MCVAVLVESSVGVSTLDLFRMQQSNPHGAGIAYPHGDKVRYIKGLTWQVISNLQRTIPRPYLLHFRWATHGPKVPRLCHPFPLGGRAFSKSLAGDADAVLIHNGVWNSYERHMPSHVDKHTTSDTAVAAYVAGTVGEEILDHVLWSTAIGRAAGNGRMDVTLRGDWEEHEGNMYSNLNWKHSYVRWDWDDDGGRLRRTTPVNGAQIFSDLLGNQGAVERALRGNK